MRIKIWRWVCSLGAGLFACGAVAQNFPEKPVTLTPVSKNSGAGFATFGLPKSKMEKGAVLVWFEFRTNPSITNEFTSLGVMLNVSLIFPSLVVCTCPRR